MGFFDDIYKKAMSDSSILRSNRPVMPPTSQYDTGRLGNMIANSADDVVLIAMRQMGLDTTDDANEQRKKQLLS